MRARYRVAAVLCGLAGALLTVAVLVDLGPVPALYTAAGVLLVAGVVCTFPG